MKKRDLVTDEKLLDTSEKTDQPVRWYRKLWVRVVAGSLALILLVSGVIYYLLPDPSYAVMRQDDETKDMLREQTEAIMSLGINPLDLIKQVKEAQNLQSNLTQAYDTAVTSIQNQQYDKAIESVNYLMENLNDTEDEETKDQLEMTLAELYFAAGDYEQADTISTRIIDKAEDTNGYYSFIRGIARIQKEDYEAGILDLKNAVEAGYEEKALCDTQIALASYYVGNYEEVISYGNSALEAGIDVENEMVLQYLLSFSYMQNGDFAKTVEYLDALIAKKEDSEYYYYRGVAKLALQEYEEAYQDFDKAVELGNDTTMCHYNRGICAIALGDGETGKEELQLVIDRGDEPDLTESAKELLESIQQA
ncbi:MAG: hypothetical protein EOM40_04950 [Clostridia bacterium]|nr:hypothetical protein [Clostridia bacterium]